MKKLILSLMMLGTLCLASCNSALFKQDATPLMENQASQYTITTDLFDTMGMLLEKATGLDPAKKESLLVRLSAERQKYLQLVNKQADYLESLGSVEWKSLVKDGWSLYKEIKEASK